MVKSLGGGAGLTFARVIKSADEIVISSTVLQDDNELLFSGNANKTYGYMLVLFTDITGGNIKTAWTLPAGASGLGNSGALTFGNSTTTADITVSDVHTSAGVDVLVQVGKIVIAGTSGLCNFQWAQNASDASNTTMLEGSYLIVWEEA